MEETGHDTQDVSYRAQRIRTGWHIYKIKLLFFMLFQLPIYSVHMKHDGAQRLHSSVVYH